MEIRTGENRRFTSSFTNRGVLMNRLQVCAIAACVLLAVSFAAGQAPKDTIDAITDNPGKYNQQLVEVEGLVSQYVPSTSTSTSYYLLKSYFGGLIRVNTSEPAPEINKKYRVTGIVYIDPTDNTPFISEKMKTTILDVPLSIQPSVVEVEEKSQITAAIAGGTPPYSIQIPANASVAVASIHATGLTINGISSGQTAVAVQDASVPPKAVSVEITVKSGVQKMLIIGLSILLVALIGFLVYFLTRRKSAPGITTGTSQPAGFSSDFKTVKIITSKPKTMVFIPGELVITTGEDKGKSFRIAGYPTPDGSVVSIGREAVGGERAYAHIQLDNRFRTVSHKQAEVIYRDGKLWVKNLSETNLTQVDGVELKPGEKAELKAGSSMRTGELEFQYKV
jgi:hypothetical protein